MLSMKLFIGQVGKELDQQSQDQEVRETERERDLLTQLLFWKWSLIYRLIHHIFIGFILICLFFIMNEL